MENGRTLYELNIILGRCAVAVYDDCKSRRVSLALVEDLMDTCTQIGGHIEALVANGDDGSRRSLAADEICRARYTAKVIGDNKLCPKKTIDNFLMTSNNLLNELLNPEPAKSKKAAKPVKQAKPAKPKKTKNKKQQEPKVNYDPDGFDDDI